MRTKLRRNTQSQRGNAMVEFALCFLLFLTLMVAMFEFSFVLFVKATFHHAVREGVRAAITGQTGVGFDDQHDNYIKSVIKTNTFGLLDDAALDAHVQIDYFSLAGAPLGTPEPGSIIQVSIQCYEFSPTAGLIEFTDGAGNPAPLMLSAYSSDRMEPFSEAPPGRGTVATASACDAG